MQQYLQSKQPQLPPPNIDRNQLSQLLLACTTKCPFSLINGLLYLQKDGVAMGSSLGVTFANFYMCHIENSILDTEPEFKPTTYCRYIEDIFIVTDSIEKPFETQTIIRRDFCALFYL